MPYKVPFYGPIDLSMLGFRFLHAILTYMRNSCVNRFQNQVGGLGFRNRHKIYGVCISPDALRRRRYSIPNALDILLNRHILDVVHWTWKSNDEF